MQNNIYDQVKVFWGHNNKFSDITEFVSKKTWEGDYKNSGRKVSLEVVTFKLVDIKNGDIIELILDKKRLFKGIVKDISKNNNSNVFSYTVFDKGHVLLNTDTKIYNEKTAEEITKDILISNKIKVGELCKTTKKMNKIFLNKSIYEMIMIAYTEASKDSGKKYMLAVTDEKINIIEKGSNILNIEFKEGENILSATYNESIENMINRVVVKDSKGNIKTIKQKEEWVKLYGIMQNVITLSNSNDTIDSAFKNAEKTCQISGFGDITTITGAAVYVKDTKTNLIGKFYIDSDKHTFEGGVHKIELKLNFVNIFDEKFGGDEKQKEQSVNNVSIENKGGWREVPAEFTAY